MDNEVVIVEFIIHIDVLFLFLLLDFTMFLWKQSRNNNIRPCYFFLQNNVIVPYLFIIRKKQNEKCFGTSK